MSDIDFVIAESAIRQLHSRYADSVWLQEWDAFGECFALDCVWKISGMTLHGRADIVDYMRELFTTKFRTLFITLRTPSLQVTGDTAIGRTYFSAQNIMADGSCFTPFGVYYEHFRKDEDGQWRFAWRLFQTLYAGGPDLSTGKYFDQPRFGPFPGMPPRDIETFNLSGLHDLR